MVFLLVMYVGVDEEKIKKDMMLSKLKTSWRKTRGVEWVRLYEKAPKKKIVNVKVNPRMIHQPR